MDKCFSVFWRRKELKKSALGNRKKERKDEGKEKGKQVFDWEQSGLEGRQCVEGDSRGGVKRTMDKCFSVFWRRKELKKSALGNRKKERKDEGKEKGKQVFDWEQSGLEGRQCVEGDSRGGVKRTMDKCFSVFWRRKELKKSALGNRKKERKDEGKEKGKQVFDWEQSGLEGRQCVEGDSRRWGKENNGQVFQCILEKKRAEKECLR